MPKGPLTTQYIGGIVADQLSKMAATIIGSISVLSYLLVCTDYIKSFTISQWPPFGKELFTWLTKKTS